MDTYHLPQMGNGKASVSLSALLKITCTISGKIKTRTRLDVCLQRIYRVLFSRTCGASYVSFDFNPLQNLDNIVQNV